MAKKKAKGLYEELRSYLEKNSTFETVDDYIIQELVFYMELFRELRKKVTDNGAVQYFPSGASNKSGEYVAMTDASKNIQALCHKLGIYEIMKGKLHNLGKATEESNEFLK